MLLRSTRRHGRRFNPLHCGAVVASGPRVEIRHHPPMSFNPLHCGAVVASFAHQPRLPKAGGVSIPFIAGQWSLPDRDAGRSTDRDVFQSPSLRGSGRFYCQCIAHETRFMFQSPSLRGSGRFMHPSSYRRSQTIERFNPLHCGAVVASLPENSGAEMEQRLFQSPSLRGSGRFKRSSARCRARSPVSIPFIAGQWSLRDALKSP